MSTPDGAEAADPAADASADATADVRVADLVEGYLSAARRGEAPDPEAFLAGHPGLSERLRVALDGVAFVRRAGHEMADLAGDAPATPRETLGDFRIVREVGRGGMGVVYEAEQLSLGRRVALKVLPFAAVLDERQLQRFRHEAQAAAFLHHTNIVPVYSVGTERGVHYYAMEFVEGRTLAAVIEELREARKARRARDAGRRTRARHEPPAPGPSSSAEARALTPDGGTESAGYCRAIARLGLQAAEGLDHAHEQGVVHRDVKPANLLVDAGGRLWITDFGLARNLANPGLTATGAIVGTLGYMSPEQAMGKRAHADPRSDVYSLGVTLLEALTLEAPFQGEDPKQVLHDILHKEASPPRRANPAVPPTLETILLKAVAKEPGERFATAKDMADDLRRFLANEPIRARRAPLLHRATLWARRHRVGVAAAACVAAFGVVALAVDSARRAAAMKDVERARDEAERSAAAARASSARAEASLAKAREAIDRMLTRVGHRNLAGIPGLVPVRRALLEDAVRLYDDLITTAGDDPASRLQAATALRLLGERFDAMGARAPAETQLNRARSILTSLAPEDGPWQPALTVLVDADRVRAGAIWALGRRTEALDVASHAVALADRCAKERPYDAQLTWSLACTLQVQGSLLRQAQRFGEAESALRRCVSVAEAGAKGRPSDDSMRIRSAGGLVELGEVLRHMGRNADAEQVLHRGVEVSEKHLLEPTDSSAFTIAVKLRTLLGEILLEQERLDEAIPRLREALEARIRANTEFPGYGGDLSVGRVSGSLACALFRVGRTEEARTVFAEEIRRLDAAAKSPDGGLLVDVAMCLLVDGESLAEAGHTDEADVACRRAVDACRACVRSQPTRAFTQSRLAEIVSSCVAVMADRMKPEESLALAREAAAAGEQALALPDALPEYRESLARASAQLGALLHQRGDALGAQAPLRRAVEVLRERSRAAPNSLVLADGFSKTLLDWARALEDSGDFSGAEAALLESLEIAQRVAAEGTDPMHRVQAEAFRLRSFAAQGRGDRTAAEEHARSSVEHARRDFARSKSPAKLGSACLRLGDVLSAAGRAVDALASYREASAALGQIPPGQQTTFDRARMVLARCNAGRCLLKQGAAGEAEQDLRAALGLIDAWSAEERANAPLLESECCAALAQTHRDAGRSREARDLLERALEALPNRADATGMLVEELADAKDPAVRDPARAVEIARAALACVPVDRARLAGQREGELRALDLRPADAWSSLALALVCSGSFQEAIEAFAKSREHGRAQDETDATYEALAHARLGHADEARRLHAEAERRLRKDPKSSVTERCLRRLAEVGALLAPARPR